MEIRISGSRTYVYNTLTESMSDGYHSFDELYEHRNLLVALVANSNRTSFWKARKHHDGTEFEEYFLLQSDGLPGGTIGYHLPNSLWDLIAVPEYEIAPVPYDGYTPDDVLDALRKENHSLSEFNVPLRLTALEVFGYDGGSTDIRHCHPTTRWWATLSGSQSELQEIATAFDIPEEFRGNGCYYLNSALYARVRHIYTDLG